MTQWIDTDNTRDEDHHDGRKKLKKQNTCMIKEELEDEKTKVDDKQPEDAIEDIEAKEAEDENENIISVFGFDTDYMDNTKDVNLLDAIREIKEEFKAKEQAPNVEQAAPAVERDAKGNKETFAMKRRKNWRKRKKKKMKRKQWNDLEDEKPEQTDDDIEAKDDVTKETSACGVEKENIYACNECETKTRVYQEPQGTQSSLFSKGTMPCSHCDKRFANTRELATHIEIIHERRYPLSRHMKSHSEERPHKCSVCEKLFKTLAKLQDHVNTHTSKGPHKCKYCEANFTTMSKLKKHMRCHSGEKPHQCECDICHAEFTRSNNLKEHKTIHTGDGSVHQCKLCHTTCNRKADLRLHVQKLHTSKKPMQCEMCGKRLPDRNALKVHEKKHTRERCSKCDSCPYRSISQRHLKTHMLIHKNQKPFQCDGCDQSFRQRQLLKRHQSLYHKPALGRNSSLDDDGMMQREGFQLLLDAYTSCHDPDQLQESRKLQLSLKSWHNPHPPAGMCRTIQHINV